LRSDSIEAFDRNEEDTHLSYLAHLRL